MAIFDLAVTLQVTAESRCGRKTNAVYTILAQAVSIAKTIGAIRAGLAIGSAAVNVGFEFVEHSIVVALASAIVDAGIGIVSVKLAVAVGVLGIGADGARRRRGAVTVGFADIGDTVVIAVEAVGPVTLVVASTRGRVRLFGADSQVIQAGA